MVLRCQRAWRRRRALGPSRLNSAGQRQGDQHVGLRSFHPRRLAPVRRLRPGSRRPLRCQPRGLEATRLSRCGAGVHRARIGRRARRPSLPGPLPARIGQVPLGDRIALATPRPPATLLKVFRERDSAACAALAATERVGGQGGDAPYGLAAVVVRKAPTTLAFPGRSRSLPVLDPHSRTSS